MFKINGNFPYPVLLEEEKYFKNSFIHAEYYKAASEDEHIIKIDCIIENQQILELIKQKKAKYLVQIESPNAFYRKIFSFESADDIEIKISKDEIIDYMDMGIAVVATEDINDYANDDFIDEYQGISFDIRKNEVIAVANPRKRIEIIYDGEILKEVKNLFILRKGESEYISYSTEGDRIIIYLPQDYMNKYSDYKNINNNDVIQILNSLIIVPVLTGVVHEMIDIDDMYKYKKWYKTLKSKIEEIANNEKRSYESCIQEPLETAQKLFNNSISKVVENINHIMEVNS